MAAPGMRPVSSGQLRGKKNLTRLMQNSVAVFDRLEAETGQAISWKKVGSLRLAGSPARWSEIRRAMGQAKSFGVECHSLSATEAKSAFSLHHHRWHRGCSLHSWRRLHRSLFADHGLCQGGADERRADRGGRLRRGDRRRQWARERRRHHGRQHRLRRSGELRRALGQAGRRAWPASSLRPASSSTSISSPRRRCPSIRA